MSKFGFIGCGNMGGALLRAVAEQVGGNNVYASDFDENKVNTLSRECGIISCDNFVIAKECDYIFLGVKPQVLLRELLPSIKEELKNRATDFVLVSMAAGISTETITSALGHEWPVIRIMPNIPASVGNGMILYCTNGAVGEEQTDIFIKAMSKSGIVDSIPEKLIDAASAVSGCGPAFVYLFIEALADGGVDCGLPRSKALLYAAQTVKGAADMLIKSGKHPGELKDAVCSPGGTTIEGVYALEKGAFRATTMDAVIKAYNKTKELGKN